MRPSHATSRPALIVLATLLAVALAASGQASDTIPTEISQPGTQPGEVGGFSSSCGCHYNTSNPQWEPGFGWEGGMMANAGRDPIFWATVAIAEQDFLPNADPAQRGGAGDLCIRCHSVGGWLNGNSTPTDGSGLAGDEDRGVECEFCHQLVNPDLPLSISGTVEQQSPPFEAFDPISGEAYVGTGQYVINGNGTRLGPYAEGDEQANHAALGSSLHRSADLCGTCHDVSNPAVGDLAHNHGAQQVMLDPGTFSGVPGAAVDTKAAFNNPPASYGVVERTFSEWKSSAWPTTAVNDFPSLPADLRHLGGALDVAYHRAWDANLDADYADGTPRYYTCQTCHMYARTGVGCNKNNMPVRTDLPQHDQTGGGYWIPDVIQYQDAKGTLRFGGGLTSDKIDMLDAGKARAADQLTRAASIDAVQVADRLHVRVTNLTGHKLISGYPEGRRMWLNVRWLDGGGQAMAAHESGGYGPIGRTVTDLDGATHAVQSILDPETAVVYEASPGMDQGWAAQLSALGYPDAMVLTFDRFTDDVEHTLGELRTEEPGTTFHTFHFVLNNAVVSDNRIPPYRMRYDDARLRNALPVPETQFGAPGPGGEYNHWDEVEFEIPPGASTAEVRLFYQQTSWEYVQFLWLANDTAGPFLGQEGINFLDAWANTGMSPPFEMASAAATLGSLAGVPGEALLTVNDYDPVSGDVTIDFEAACDASDHNVYVGDLASVSAYAYSETTCLIGTGGTATIQLSPEDAFFFVVGIDASDEGSYGRASDGTERPEDLGTPACDRSQDLGGVTCS